MSAQAMTAMSDRRDVGADQQATSRGSFPVARSVLSFVLLFLALAPVLTMTTFGCVLPLAPTFDDPAAERNYAPMLITTDPLQGFVQPGSLKITVTDPNVTDDLWIRWIGEYPPYSMVNTRLLRDDTKVSHSADGKPLVAGSVLNVDCPSLAPDLLAHPVTALVSDRAFVTRADDPTLSGEAQYITVSKGALTAEAHWVVNVSCR
jgi:hypothetical protein